MAYDPELDLLYIGIGNGSPWNRKLRSPGGGDNLFLSSIVALRPDTGEIRLALPDHAGRDLGLHRDPAHRSSPTSTIDGAAAQGDHAGAEERLLLRARPRRPAQLISANAFVPINWATGVDMATGRRQNPEARYGETGKPFVAQPGPAARTAGNR